MPIAIAVTIAITVAIAILVTVVSMTRSRREMGDGGHFNIVDHHAENIGSSFGKRTRAMLNRREMRSVGAAHNKSGIGQNCERNNIAHKPVRRRVDNDLVVIGARPRKEFHHNARTEDCGRRDSLRRKRADNLKTIN